MVVWEQCYDEMLLSDHAVTTAQFSDGPHTQTEPPVPFTFMTSKATNWHTSIMGRWGGEGSENIGFSGSHGDHGFVYCRLGGGG